jgi:ubiquinone/menaquinone biosynthesis C-methylase UbiE
MSNQAQDWSKFYERTKINPVYPTEWVIRTIGGANYPNFKFDKNLYIGKRILDISCGDGRNLELLLNLGFEVYATEISEETVALLAKRFPNVSFNIGYNHKHPFPDNYFDFALACGSLYYLEHGTHFFENLIELNRILKPTGILFSNMVTEDHYVLNNATKLNNNEYLITDDPHNFRNGYRWAVSNSVEDLQKLMAPYFSLMACSKLLDDYFGYLISNYIIVAKNLKS